MRPFNFSPCDGSFLAGSIGCVDEIYLIEWSKSFIDEIPD